MFSETLIDQAGPEWMMLPIGPDTEVMKALMLYRSSVINCHFFLLHFLISSMCCSDDSVQRKAYPDS